MCAQQHRPPGAGAGAARGGVSLREVKNREVIVSCRLRAVGDASRRLNGSQISALHRAILSPALPNSLSANLA